jgi:alpha-beta hydrolase superfamily lysophospholipase
MNGCRNSSALARLPTIPVFILHGTSDKTTLASGSQLFYDTAGSGSTNISRNP